MELQTIDSGIEPLQPLYLSPDFLSSSGRIAQQKIFRINIGAGRHYRNEGGQTFKSITTFLDAVMPPNRILGKWRDKKIEELGSVGAMSEFVQATADYGTALHIAVADYCINGKVVWSDFEDWAYNYFIGMKMQPETIRAAVEELTKDFASMIAFIHEYQVRVIAVEIPVFSSDGFATLIDLVCEMNALNYTEKTPQEKRARIIAGINLKSGKKGFHDSHVFQLVGERRAFNETYGQTCGFALEEMFNLAPNDWEKVPTFKMKNQTKTIESGGYEEEFDLYVRLGKKRKVLGTPSKDFHIFEGETIFGADPTLNLQTLNYEEFAVKRLGIEPNENPM